MAAACDGQSDGRTHRAVLCDCAGHYWRTIAYVAATSGLLDLCLKHDVSMIAAAPFDSGILATGAIAGARSGYKTATADILARVQAMERLCLAHGVALQAAALQYPLQHPAVASVLAGMKTAAEVQQNATWITTPIGKELWGALAKECGVAQSNV